MNINILDNIIKNTIDKLYDYIKNSNTIKQIYKENDFIKYLNEILEIIKKFYKKEKEKIINTYKKNFDNNHFKLIFRNIKRYIAFYLFLDIAYHYKGDQNLFLINLIEISKDVKNYTFIIDNFFDSINNNILFNYFLDIKNIITLQQYKTLERINIIINNNPIKYASIKKIKDTIPLELFETFFDKDNKHNILLIFIYRFLYYNEERYEIKRLLLYKEKKDAEYKYITIQVSKKDKIIDYMLLNNFIKENKLDLDSNDIYEFMKDYNNETSINLFKEKQLIQDIFSSKIFIPISREFMNI